MTIENMPNAQTDKGHVEPFELRHHLAQCGQVVAKRVRENRVAKLLGRARLFDRGFQIAQTDESRRLGLFGKDRCN
ncbi:hypothetical protein [Paraburkholderia sp. BL23I1N1]|uniref:hypothetical protein n=1 Tax=Paraburkholderia sp. BL23I1N1 TaxID=1938802 RepID=UPI001601EEC8|nr:hypothetical protein [Paraburkholderia sp. BL23I1N1]